MKKPVFKTGDVVALKSGGTSMTVAGYDSNGLVEVIHMSSLGERGLMASRVPEGCLKALEVKKTKRVIEERELVTRQR